MPKINPYTWLLTVVLGVALANATNDLGQRLLHSNASPDPNYIELLLLRYSIFLLLCIRWGVGAIWFMNLGYQEYVESDNRALQVSRRYFAEFVVAFFNFFVLSILSLAIPLEKDSESLFSQWLNCCWVDKRSISDFWLILALFCVANSFYLLVRCSWSRFRRVQLVRLVSNLCTLSLLVVLIMGSGQITFLKNEETALSFFLIFLLFSTALVLLSTVIKSWLSDRIVVLSTRHISLSGAASSGS